MDVCRKFTVKIPMYRINILVEVSDQPNVRSLVVKWTGEDDEKYEWSDGAVLNAGVNVNPVVVFASDVTDAVVVHECVHLAHRVLDHIGHPVSTYNDEPFAYLVEWLFSEIWGKIKSGKK